MDRWKRTTDRPAWLLGAVLSTSAALSSWSGVEARSHVRQPPLTVLYLLCFSGLLVRRKASPTSRRGNTGSNVDLIGRQRRYVTPLVHPFAALPTNQHDWWAFHLKLFFYRRQLYVTPSTLNWPNRTEHMWTATEGAFGERIPRM
jgi:hypothetical protein